MITGFFISEKTFKTLQTQNNLCFLYSKNIRAIFIKQMKISFKGSGSSLLKTYGI